jgi:hypothetical protein
MEREGDAAEDKGASDWTATCHLCCARRQPAGTQLWLCHKPRGSCPSRSHPQHCIACGRSRSTCGAGRGVEVRGVCPGCGLNVWSDDESRKREGNVYFHGACIKGTCSGCGKVVHVDQDRKKIGAEYWHEDCAPGPSSRGRQR